MIWECVFGQRHGTLVPAAQFYAGGPVNGTCLGVRAQGSCVAPWIGNVSTSEITDGATDVASCHDRFLSRAGEGRDWVALVAALDANMAQYVVALSSSTLPLTFGLLAAFCIVAPTRKYSVCCIWPGYCQITCGRCDCCKTFATVLRQMGARTFLQVPCQYDLEAPDASDWLPRTRAATEY